MKKQQGAMGTVMATGHTADSSMMDTHSDTLSHQGVVITEHVWPLRAFTHSRKSTTNRVSGEDGREGGRQQAELWAKSRAEVTLED